MQKNNLDSMLENQVLSEYDDTTKLADHIEEKRKQIERTSKIIGIQEDLNLIKEKKRIDIPCKKITFSIPLSDIKLIEEHMDRLYRSGIFLNKSELIRIGLKLVSEQTEDKLAGMFNELPKLIKGRPTHEN